MAIQDTPFEDRPYPYQAHGTFLTPLQGAASPTGQAGGQGLMSAIGPVLGSMLAPSQDQPAAPPPPAQQSPQYVLGPDADDQGPGSREFADRIGQGVLAASQAAVAQQQKKKGMGGMGGQMGGGGGGASGGVGAGFGSGGIMGGSV